MNFQPRQFLSMLSSRRDGGIHFIEPFTNTITQNIKRKFPKEKGKKMNEEMLMFFHYGSSKEGKAKKKKKAGSWFETLNASQLKDLCKASKLKVSGTKAELCGRLFADSRIRDIGLSTQFHLKNSLKEKMLVQSGNKYAQVLRLINYEWGTGQVKRAATQIVIDQETGETVQTLKKRKINPKPETIYMRIQKKVKSASQKKYQTKYGSRSHAPGVYKMLKDLTEQFCIESNIVVTDSLLAFRVAKAGFKSLHDHWQFMEDPGYGENECRDAFEKLEIILKAVKDKLSLQAIEEMVVLLENLNACMSSYCINMGYSKIRSQSFSNCMVSDYDAQKYNVVHRAIRIIMPSYDEKSRPTKPKSKMLVSDIQGLALMNGIPYP